MNPEIIDISSYGGSASSSNFGDGIELLMNDKKGSTKHYDDNIDVTELETLEAELNEMSDTGGGGFNTNTLFSDRLPETINIDSNDEKPSVRFGNTSGDSAGSDNTSTWDGYNRFNEIPVMPDKTMQSQPTQTKEEILREKFQLLRKLESLEHKGVQLSKKYTMDSPILEMKGEYETIIDEKAKQNSIKFQGNMLMTCINGIEFLNNRFDPFDIKLDGWSEQVAENVDDYDEVFGELYDKYKSKGTMAPELRLLFQLGGSAMMLHMTNAMFKSAMPGMDDVLRQNPDLAQQFQKAAMESMGTTSPGFSGFMNNMTGQPQPPSTHTPPPPPQATQGPNAVPAPGSRHGNNNSFSSRPDLDNMSGMGGHRDGMNISENFSSATSPERSSVRPPQNSQSEQQHSNRPEMRGPSDLDHLLSGLKTKKVSMTNSERSQAPHIETTNPIDNTPYGANDSSTISISDLKHLQTPGTEPKRSRRRNTSEKNTVSLDI
jgi:hypothetical protein